MISWYVVSIEMPLSFLSPFSPFSIHFITLIPFPALVSGEGVKSLNRRLFFSHLHPSLGLRLFDPGFVMKSRFLETGLYL